MKQTLALLETGVYHEQQVAEESGLTVHEYLEDLGLTTGKLLGVLVNGKKVPEDYRLRKTDKIVILPAIAGG